MSVVSELCHCSVGCQCNNGKHIIIIIIIIIITNEEIKVTLSRKRCRGTLHDYDKGKISI